MVRVWFVNRFYAPCVSATAQLLTELAEALAADGHDVRVITSRALYADASALLPRRNWIQGVTVHRVATTRFGRDRLVGRAIDYLSFYGSATYAVIRGARRDDIVIAKTDPPLLGVPVGWAARMRGARLMQWLQDLFPEVAARLGMRLAQGLPGALLTRVRNRSLQRSDCVVIGSRMQETVQAALGRRHVSIHTIPNWTDIANLRPISGADHPMRRELGLEGRFVLGYSGNLGRAHDTEIFLVAAEQLQKASAPPCWLFIGGGTGFDYLQAQVRQRGLTGWKFLPYQRRDQLALSLSLPDVHLVSLKPELEGLIVPSKLYGVAAVGCPLVFVGDQDGEVARAVRAGEFGYTMAPDDSDALVQTIAKLQSDPKLCQRLGANARRTAEQQFGFEHALAQWRVLLRG